MMTPVTGYRRRLRSRIFISFALFGIGLTVLFAVATIYMRGRIEAQLLNDTLAQQVKEFADFKRSNPDPDAPWTFPLVRMSIYSERFFQNVPPEWRHYDTGVYEVHETDLNGQIRPYKLAVYKAPDVWAFMRYDISSQQLSERQLLIFLAAALVMFSVLALFIGAWLSNRVIRPVTDLAQRLRGFREDGRVETLAPHFANDEVGELAEALDEYAERLTHVVERDREFNSDVSHELRTPLAVIASTTELLQSSPDLTDKLRERLKRIERSSRQATELIEALLLLSRAERSGPMDGETSDVGRMVKDVVASQKPQLRGKDVAIHVDTVEPLAVNAPSSVLAVALTNLIGNAIKYTQQGEVRIRIGDGKVAVTDTGRGIGDEDVQRLFQRGVRGKGVSGSGAGLGLAIVIRLCDLYGWQVSLQPRQDTHGTVATLDFVQPPGT